MTVLPNSDLDVPGCDRTLSSAKKSSIYPDFLV